MKNEILITRFDGGYNTKATPQMCNPSESPDLQCVIFDDFGAVETMRGMTKLNSSRIATAPVVGLSHFIPASGDSQLIAACNGSIWRATGAATTFAAIASGTSVYTASVPVFMNAYQDQLWISNGYSNNYKYNGTEFTRWGVVTCSAATGATTSAGTLTGEYRYVILGINSNSVQGNYGTATTAITAASKQISLTEIPVFAASAGVNYKAICRNTAGASAIYYIVTQIANTATAYVDNNSDSTLVTEAPIDNGLPPAFICHAQLKGRTFGISPNSSDLYYSSIDEPEIWPTENFLEVNDGDGLYCAGLAVLSDSLLIAKNSEGGAGSLYWLYMPDADDTNWTLRNLDSWVGGQAPKAMAAFSNYIMMINRFGVWDLSQVSPGVIKPDPISFNIESIIESINKAYISRCTAIAWKNKLWLSVPYGSTATYNNKLLQYDFVKGRNANTRDSGAWSVFTGMNLNDFAVHNGNLYAGDATDGFVHQLDTGYNINSSAIDSYFKTYAIGGKPEHENYTKVFRKIWVLVEAVGDWYMDVDFFVDFQTTEHYSKQISLKPTDTSNWDAFDWDTGKWDSVIERKLIAVDLRNCVGKYMQVKFSTNTADQYFKVHNMRVQYILKGER